MSKHTPGPWVHAEAAPNQRGIFSGDRPPAMGRRPLVAIMIEGNQAANASLMCAAPDLLDALKELVEMLRKEAPGTPLNNPRFDALGIKCNTAISKAEGRQ